MTNMCQLSEVFGCEHGWRGGAELYGNEPKALGASGLSVTVTRTLKGAGTGCYKMMA